MKTYCISDIHGHLNNLNKFIKTLNDDDIVYVLGDVVDKGSDSIKTLQLIMNDKRFKMLLGNHEYMMFQVLSNEIDSYDYSIYYDNWINYNSGDETLKQYEALPHYEQLRIFNFIKELPLNYPNIKVNDKTYYLVHSCPHSDIQLKMKDIAFDDDTICKYVWDRVNPLDRLDINDQVVIAGHTPVQYYIGLTADKVEPVFDYKNKLGSTNKDIHSAHYIDIDGGLAADLDNSRLIALCLDDLNYRVY